MTRVADTAQAAQALESYFLRRVLSEVRSPDQGLLDGGFAGGMFKEMLDESLADSMAAAGGIGVGKAVERQLEPGGVATKRPTPTQGHAAYALSAAPLTTPPLDGPMTSSSFGRRVDPLESDVRQHNGLDLAAPAGAPVRAAGAGIVRFAGDAGSYGNLVVVDHGGGLETRYAHLSAVAVKAGEPLAAGATVGAVGQTGRATGPHLHFEVRRGGQATDPAHEFSASSLPRPGRTKDWR